MTNAWQGPDNGISSGKKKNIPQNMERCSFDLMILSAAGLFGIMDKPYRLDKVLGRPAHPVPWLASQE
jgi:hypothetical protein